MKIGELFAGYGGLGMGVQAVLGGDVAWVSDIDKGANKILTHRFPGVPNIGDITAVDWAKVEPVDVLTGGFPCQDVSAAGKRAGIRPGTRSGLWAQFAYAISALRPRMVVIENVRGLLSARAHSDVEPCAWCVGDDTDGALRALGAVLGDLARLGYDARWHGLRAADVGAPHGRFRVFVVAHPHDRRRGEPDAGLGRVPVAGGGSNTETAALLPTPRAGDGEKGGPNQRGSSGDLMLPSAVQLLGTPTARDYKGTGPVGSDSYEWLLDHGNVEAQVLSLLPTPAVNDMGEGKTPEAWDEWTAKMKAAHGNGNGNGASLSIEAQRLLGTPTARMTQRSEAFATPGETPAEFARTYNGEWGQYAAAIARWEALTRPAPPPTELSAKGTPRLSAAFSEFLMGLPAGWVTDVPGITRNEALKALGNGVVPAQAAAALRILLGGEGLPAVGAARLLPTTNAADANASGGNAPCNVTLTDAVVRTGLGAHANARHGGAR